MPDIITIEWAPFKLAPGVDESRLLRASEDLQKGFLEQQKGFIKRELLKDNKGQWIDLVYWASPEAARQAMEQAANSPVCFAYFQLMQGEDHNNPGNGVQHFSRVRHYWAQDDNHGE